MKIKLSVLSALLLSCGLSHAASLPQGSGSFEFVVPQTQKKMEVFTYQPPGANAQTPVVFILAGLNRDADKYRDSWVENATKNKLIVIAPLYSEKDYPGNDGYNLGNLVNAKTDKVNPRGEWAFTVIDDLFANMQKQGITQQKQYYLFGNSAGCQFAHRMLTFVPEAKVKAAMCAAAGWWTMPDVENPWPYGLDGAPVDVTQKQLADYFALPVLITVGSKDSDPYHPLLRRSYAAMTQGDSRLTRAETYFLTAKQKAKRYKVPFNWQFTTLKGVGHNGEKMSAYGAEQFAWFEQHGKFKTPEEQETKKEGGDESKNKDEATGEVN
jgi:poly(3-hydroxybutyrate) depolymerase